MAKLEYRDRVNGDFKTATGAAGAMDVNIASGSFTSTVDLSLIGAQADAAATTDTGTFSIFALMKRGLQNWTSLLAKVPAKGVAASAASMPVVLASDDAQVGTKVTTSPALGAGGTGIIGWLSNAVDKLIAIGAQLPTTLGSKTSANSLSVVPASDATTVVLGSVASGSADSGNPVKVGGKYNLVLPTFTDGQRGDVQIDSAGRMMITAGALFSGADGFSNAALVGAQARNDGAVGARLLVVGAYAFNGTTWDRVTKATSTGRVLSAAASTNATSVKASAGTVYTIDLYNAAATVKYLKLYNKASAPTVGTDTPVRTIALKPTDKTTITFPNGLYFATGIALALTGAAADADTTALTAADVVGLNVDYS